MKETKKFISPLAWFSMEYPKNWFEFEDAEGSFLFYNPDSWDGNFRISADRGYSKFYGEEVLEEELRKSKIFRKVPSKQGELYFASSNFVEEENEFTSNYWLYALGEMFFACTFTAEKGSSPTVAEAIIESIVVRDLDKKYEAEFIPIRLSEIYKVNNDFEWVVDLVKEKYAVPFQGEEGDIAILDRLMAEGVIGKKKREHWLALGTTLAAILVNEVEGLEWYTLIDGNREDPILLYMPTNLVIDPMKLVWSKVKAGVEFTIAESYQEALSNISEAEAAK